MTRRDLLLVLLLGVLVALFFWRIITPNPADRAQFPPGDFTDQFYAFRLVEARAFASGHLPLWSENFNSGHPFLADVQAAVFYPIGLINTLINVALTGPNFSLFALEIEALLHFWLAGIFTYLFARRMIGGRAGAFASAVVFTFGGYLTSYPPLQLVILETATWLPLALLFLDLAAGTNRRSLYLVLAGITLGIAALAGHPQTFVFVLVTCAAFWAYQTLWVSKNPKGLAWLFPVVLVALGIAAAQLIPSIEYQQLSVRQSLSFSQAATGLPTLDLLQFILPGFTSAFASPLYIGVLSLWLALVALLRGGRDRVFWGIVALGALILSFGYYVFAYAALYQIPLVGLFRQQERWAFIVSFALAILAGFGLQDLLTASRRRFRKPFLLLPAGIVLSLSLLLVFFVAGLQQTGGKIAFLGDRTGLMLLLFGLATILVGVFISGRLSPRVLIPLAIALVLFDLWSVNEPANKAAPGELYPENEVINQIRTDDGLFRVAAEGKSVPGHYGIGYNLEEIGGISPLRLARYDDLLGLDPSGVYRLLNVRYVYSAQPNVANADVLMREGDMALWKLKDTAPRAWLVGQVQENVSDEQALEMLSAGLDTRHVALLPGSSPFPLSDAASNGQLTVTVHEPEWMVMQVNAPADGLLVIGENYYPGWTARVDGVPVDILRADVTLRAVPVQAGSHEIELTFDPLSVKIGIAISTLTFLLSIGLIAFAATGRQRILRKRIIG